MPAALLSTDHRDHVIVGYDQLIQTFEKWRRLRERYILHAHSVNDKHVADIYTAEVNLLRDVIDEIALRIQVERGL